MEIMKISDQDFKEKIESNDKVVIDCYATWCGPCRMLAPIIEDIASEFKDIQFYKLDVDENEKISKEYKIMSIPTLLFFNKGILKETSIGLKSKEEILEILDKKL